MGTPLHGVSIIGFTLFFIPVDALSFFPPSSTRTVQYIYQLIANYSAACMACHLTDSQIPLQADWLCLCSLQASVHIYTVTYRVTYRRVCTYYIVGHYRDTTWMHACLYNELTHKLTGCFGVNYSDVLVTFFVTEWLF